VKGAAAGKAAAVIKLDEQVQSLADKLVAEMQKTSYLFRVEMNEF